MRLNRRQLLEQAGLAGAALATGSFAASAEGEPSGWRAGTAMEEITPPLDVGILMSSGRRLWAPFVGVRMPLCAQALVIDNGHARVGLVALDLLGLAGEAVGGWQAFKQRLVAHAAERLSHDSIVLACSHTHSGPESLALTDLYKTKAFQAWVDVLCDHCSAALGRASRALVPVRLVGSTAPAQGWGVNRRIKTERGIVYPGRVRPDDKVIGPEGPTDEQVRVLAMLDAVGKPAAIIVNATAHAICEMCIKQVSPDYPGEMSKLLEASHPGSRALFLQGAAGNISSSEVSTGAEGSRRQGRRLAEAVEQALLQAQPIGGKSLRLQWAAVDLPARSPTGQPLPQPLKTCVGALRLGNAALVFLPGEPFLEIALGIRQASPFGLTMVAGYCEDYIGYIPTDRAFRNGGYEIGPGRWSRVGAGSEGLMRQAAITLLQGINK